MIAPVKRITILKQSGLTLLLKSCASLLVALFVSNIALAQSVEESAPTAHDDPLTQNMILDDELTFVANNFPVAQPIVGGFIGDAVIRNRVQIGIDHMDSISFPNRAEYRFATPLFGARDFSPFVKSFSEIDITKYQELTSLVEIAIHERFSVVGEFPIRFINGVTYQQSSRQFRDYQGGLGDITAGIRWGVLSEPHKQVTAQLKTSIPTGNAINYFGTGHSSLEFALQFQNQVADRVFVIGELADWQAIGASELDITDLGYRNMDPSLDGQRFGGNVLSYGLGLAIDFVQPQSQSWISRWMGIVEVQGWTVLQGHKVDEIGQVRSFFNPFLFDEAIGPIENAAGDTIIQFNLGTRINTTNNSLFVGYGISPTGSRWHRNAVRLELTRTFGGIR